MARTFRINDRAFKDLILYVSGQLADDESFGDTKLNKILCFSDFDAFRLLGEPITGAEYQRNHHGPTARVFPILRDQMVRDGEITLENVDMYGQKATVVRANVEPTAELSEEQREIVDSVIEQLRPYNNVGVSVLSHERCSGWLAHDQGEAIPYQTAIITTDEPEPEVVSYFRQLEGLPAV